MHRENLAGSPIIQIHCDSYQMAFRCGSAALCNLRNLWIRVGRLTIHDTRFTIHVAYLKAEI